MFDCGQRAAETTDTYRGTACALLVIELTRALSLRDHLVISGSERDGIVGELVVADRSFLGSLAISYSANYTE